eukprot:TRINITY_DN9319_c0_g1_i5.p1 TRINITY_DN9319_c0_g1~~TRINITY_DN9319_c0_g1_i5.p1  ORF type:complete len:242 (+),score=77.16 TRINITY_DN9319_c0_g1_i5:146-871(+)
MCIRDRFGAPAAPAAAGGMFGAPAAAPAGGGLFGSPAAAPAGGGLFGAPAAAPATGGMFGTPAAAPAGGLFGSPAAPAAGGGLFGAAGLAPAAGPNMLGGLGNSMLNPSENYGLHNEDMYFRELTPQNQQRIDQIRTHVQHHKTEKDQLLATWSRAELVHREEDFRSFETRILNLGVEQKKDATMVDQLTTTTYKDINHVIEAKETVRRIVATKGHGAQGYNITGSPLTTQVLQSAALSSV